MLPDIDGLEVCRTIRAHENVFVDHLGFVLGEDGWKIVSKIWHLEKVVEA